MNRTKIKELLANAQVGETACVKGWVRTKRVSKQAIFITLNDGSALDSLQIVTTPSQITEATLQRITPGSSLCAEGILTTSQGAKQCIELHSKKLTVLGTAIDYPLQPKRHSFAFLREMKGQHVDHDVYCNSKSSNHGSNLLNHISLIGQNTRVSAC